MCVGMFVPLAVQKISSDMPKLFDEAECYRQYSAFSKNRMVASHRKHTKKPKNPFPFFFCTNCFQKHSRPKTQCQLYEETGKTVTVLCYIYCYGVEFSIQFII